MGDPSPPAPAERRLADITLELQARLTELAHAADTMSAPANLWIITSACERTLTQLTDVLKPLPPWLREHQNTLTTHGQSTERLGERLQQLSDPVAAIASGCHVFAGDLSRLGARPADQRDLPAD